MKKNIVISGINLYEGGTLSVLKDCLNTIEHSKNLLNYDFIVLVHKKALFDLNLYRKIKFIEFPYSRISYIFRLFYEFYYFKKFVVRNNIYFWFSIHDITPNVGNIQQAVYCHNPTPFGKIIYKDLYIQPKLFLFSIFYSLLYKINIKKNKFVIVQQLWIKNEFCKRFNLDYDKIIIAKPQESNYLINYLDVNTNYFKSFIYPTYPRPFKNIEIIGEAAKILINNNHTEFEIIITIDGSENKYSKLIYDKYKNIKQLKFIGIQTRDDIFKLYNKSDCLIFPSMLETWGMPISEFKKYGKTMIIADKIYAKETVGEYQKVKFFNPTNPHELATNIKNFQLNTIKYDNTKPISYPQPAVNNWEELLLLILNENT